MRVSRHATPLPAILELLPCPPVQRFGVVELRVTTSLYYHSWLRSSTPFIFLQRTCPTSTTSPRTLRFQNPKKRVSWSLSRTRSVGEMRLLQLPLRVREVILGVHTRQPPSTRRSRAERWRYVNTACLCSSGCGLERKVVLHAPNSSHTDTYTQLPYTPHTTTRSANSRVHQTTQRAEAAAPNNMPSRSPNFGGAPPQGTGDRKSTR